MTIEHNASTPATAAQTETLGKGVNWTQVGLFVGLTFGLTWLLDLVLYLKGGLTVPAATVALQFQMLLPAFSAILLGMFVFKDSPIHVKNNHSKSRWFTWYFLGFTLLYAAASILALLRPAIVPTLSLVMLIPSLIGLILVVVLRAVGGKETFAAVGMAGGKARLWLLLGLGIILFAGSQTLLNWLFRLGQPTDLNALAAPVGLPVPVLLLVSTIQTLILGPFLGLLITFGEEYGWRGYLQPALSGLGRVRAVALVGAIWGIWHWPVIWMGYNYPGHPLLGSLLMVVFSMGLAFVLGYAVLKAKGIWIAAFLHALINQSFSYFLLMFYAPTNPVLSFGMGLPGLAFMALIVVLILRDPVWKEND